MKQTIKYKNDDINSKIINTDKNATFYQIIVGVMTLNKDDRERGECHSFSFMVADGITTQETFYLPFEEITEAYNPAKENYSEYIGFKIELETDSVSPIVYITKLTGLISVPEKGPTGKMRNIEKEEEIQEITLYIDTI